MAARNRGNDAKDVSPALPYAREGNAETGKSAAINMWVDRKGYASENKNEGMYK